MDGVPDERLLARGLIEGSGGSVPGSAMLPQFSGSTERGSRTTTLKGGCVGIVKVVSGEGCVVG